MLTTQNFLNPSYPLILTIHVSDSFSSIFFFWILDSDFCILFLNFPTSLKKNYLYYLLNPKCRPEFMHSATHIPKTIVILNQAVSSTS